MVPEGDLFSERKMGGETTNKFPFEVRVKAWVDTEPPQMQMPPQEKERQVCPVVFSRAAVKPRTGDHTARKARAQHDSL